LRFVFVFVLLLSLQSFAGDALNSYNIDPTQTTVSGLSSGACMSTQFHVSHSSEIMGVAVIAGCPYYCANTLTSLAILCMDGVVNVPELISATSYAEASLSIDSTRNMKDALVWLYSGTQDTVVNTKAVEAVETYYQHYVDSPNQISSTLDIPSVHGWVTVGQGLACSNFSSPFVNNCTFSASEELLKFFYGDLNHVEQSNDDNLFAFDQGLYTPGFTPASVSMDETGFVYVPTSCQNGEKCKLHICFHGCEQGYQFVQNTFIETNQLNMWAESNNIIVLYPQAVSTAGINPYGCWDWWGYTGLDYATKLGSQIKAVYKMMGTLMGK